MYPLFRNRVKEKKLLVLTENLLFIKRVAAQFFVDLKSRNEKE
jgi:hypothetical protein